MTFTSSTQDLAAFMATTTSDNCARMLSSLCRDGHLAGIQWLLENYPYLDVQTASTTAYCNNNLTVVQWLLDRYPNVTALTNPIVWSNSAGIEMALVMMQWWCSCYPKVDVIMVLYAAISRATSNGRLDVLQWLTAVFTPVAMMIDSNIIKYAAEVNRLDVVIYLAATYPMLMTGINYSMLWNRCCTLGCLEIVQWLASTYRDLAAYIDYRVCFGAACRSGNLLLVQYLLDANLAIDVHANHEAVFRNSCRDGYLHIAQLLVQYYPDINVYAENNDALRCAIRYDRLTVVTWLVVTYDGFPYQEEDYWIFTDICNYGWLELAQWLLDMYPAIDVRVRNDYIFNNSCRYGSLKMAQWLSAMTPTINIHADEDGIIYTSCRNRHDNTVLWLYTMSGDYNWSDVMIGNLFSCSAQNGYLDTCIMLYHRHPNIDIHADNCGIFRNCIDYDKLHVAKWLADLSSNKDRRYYVTKNTGYIFTESTTSLWHHQHVLNYGIIHYRQPTDLPIILQHQRQLAAIKTTKSARF